MGEPFVDLAPDIIEVVNIPLDEIVVKGRYNKRALSLVLV